MRIAFYAPLKPPDHPVPSGDRRMARLLMAALAEAGHTVELACRYRSYDGKGDAARQRRLAALGGRLAAAAVRRYRRRAAKPDLWFSYHLYHKAPDWLGPPVADALGIAYVVAEASHAPKRRGGPWTLGHEAAAAAITRAERVFGLNAADAGCVVPLLASPDRWVGLTPFLDARPYAEAAEAAEAAPAHRRALAASHGLDPEAPWLLAVGMMRPGDKLRSYEGLGRALARLGGRDWRLVVVGDGPARAEAERALSAAGERVAWLGALDEAALAGVYAACDLYVWPAVNEAYGMATLEAQASGIPVVAGRTGGVPGIVADGETGLLVPIGDDGAFAAAVAALLDDAGRRRDMGRRALARVARDHDLAAAARTLNAGLAGLGPRAAP